jgi:sugar/nucleoside kinase (ribokinase family)
MSVLVIGDANVDLEIRLPSASVSRSAVHPEPRLFGGGSAANTAAALARLGVTCRFAGAVGDDGFGRFAVDSLRTFGVDTGTVQVVPEQPTSTVITVIQADGERLIYVWPPSGGAHGALEPGPAVAAVGGTEWLHVSGLCLRLEPARGALLAAMERARANGVPVSFDLNLRLENWGWDREFRSAVEAALACSDVVLGAGIDEIGALTGIDDPVAAAASLADGSRIVVARVGADGAVACASDDVVAVPGFPVEVMSTVGAGDVFDAGFIAGRRRDLDLATCLRWGNAAAALTIGRPGARSTPTLVEVERLLAE